MRPAVRTKAAPVGADSLPPMVMEDLWTVGVPGSWARKRPFSVRYSVHDWARAGPAPTRKALPRSVVAALRLPLVSGAILAHHEGGGSHGSRRQVPRGPRTLAQGSGR